jgi:putative Mg2+ transporter-C (MgtC) family protein
MSTMSWWQGVVEDFSDVSDLRQVLRLAVRLALAASLGGVLGYERERSGKAAGLRTHMLVALGAALFIVIPQQAGMTSSDLSRVIQGIVTGIGFLGAGAILKPAEQREVKGLTTAAGLWLTAAVGIAAGLGREATAILGTFLALCILSVLHSTAAWLGHPGDQKTHRRGPRWRRSH